METNNTFGFLALALRQRLINRWSLMHCQQRETVLEHSAVVALLALLAGEIAQAQGEQVDLGIMMGHAIVHDVTEVLTGDVVTPVKKASATLAAEFSALEESAQDKILNTLPQWLVNRVRDYFQPGGYEQALVKGCDVYAAYLKCKMEVAAGNGVEFLDALEQISAVMVSIKAELPVIAQLDAMFGDSFGLSVDKLLANGQGDNQ
jgi:5'-deoxynucleotidase